MIGFLRGRVSGVGADSVLLDVGGIGFEVRVGPGLRTSADTSDSGREAFFWTHTHYSQEGASLFGFESRQDLEAFKLLLGVSGVGPKLALNIVSEFPPPEIYQRILAHDVAALSGVRGVGRKLAERIVLDLRDRIKKKMSESVAGAAPALAGAGKPPAARHGSAVPTPSATESGRSHRSPLPGGGDEAVGAVEQALKALGYGRAEVEAALARVAGELGLEAQAAGEARGRNDGAREQGRGLEAEELLRAALRAMSREAGGTLVAGSGRRER